MESGIFREIAHLGREGRRKYHLAEELSETLDNLVWPGHHVLIDPGIIVKNLIVQHFAQKAKPPLHTPCLFSKPITDASVGPDE